MTPQAAEPAAPGVPRPPRALRVLLLDGEPHTRLVVAECAAGQSLTLLEAANLADARQQLEAGPVDLLLVDPNQPDGSGLDLAQELADQASHTQTIVLSSQPSVDSAIAAVRLGAADFMVKPLNVAQVSASVRSALAKRRADRRVHGRVRRLEKLCRKLQKARDEVSQQVDVICTDLVTAYQDLAGQMNQVVRTSEFHALLRKELDLEQVLRKVLEFVLEKAGPTNAAIFLPNQDGGHNLGGYINYDAAGSSPDVLLQHLADIVAPRVIEREGLLHFTDNQAVQEWVGDDWAYLADCHVIAFTCRHEGEPLAVVVLFRDASQPFTAEFVSTMTAIGPSLGDYLARLIRIHHRHIPGLNGEEDEDQAEAA